MNYKTHFQTRQTPQSEPAPGKTQVQNNAGGYVFAVDDWTRLDRFLILGTEGGTYYVGEKKLTIDNAGAVQRCIMADGQRVVSRIVEISDKGRAPKNDPALFVLAMCAGMGDNSTRKAALDALPKVARIGTHLFHFIEFVEGFRGWGRGMRRAIAAWYNDKRIDDLAFQAIKYQQRDGWSHRDLLRLAHPLTKDETRNALYKWIVKNEGEPTPLVMAFEQAKKAESKSEIVKLITDYNLPREAIPTQWLNEVDVWAALLPTMPLMALIRNLGKMSNVGLLKPMSTEYNTVVTKLVNRDYIHKSRLHPLAILIALKTYQQGRGDKGSLTWNPISQIVDALDEAFYLAFDNVEPTGKRLMLALDVSGSMSTPFGGTNVSCCEGASAMALVTAKIEKNYVVTRFNNELEPIPVSPRQRLDDVLRYTRSVNFGGTDCALPMVWALQNQVKVDTFCTYTDNETSAGHIHPFQALQQYRQQMGIPAKLVTIGMTSSGFSIADPNDAGMLDCVGFDTATPQIIADFGRE